MAYQKYLSLLLLIFVIHTTKIGSLLGAKSGEITSVFEYDDTDEDSDEKGGKEKMEKEVFLDEYRGQFTFLIQYHPHTNLQYKAISLTYQTTLLEITSPPPEA